MLVGEAGASVDAELAVGPPEVRLDGGDGDEQLLGYLAVAAAFDGERGDAALAGRQRFAPGDRVPAWSGAGRAQLVRRTGSEGKGPTARGLVHRAEQQAACLPAPTGAAQRRSELDARAGVIQAPRRPVQDVHRLVEVAP